MSIGRRRAEFLVEAGRTGNAWMHGCSRPRDEYSILLVLPYKIQYAIFGFNRETVRPRKVI